MPLRGILIKSLIIKDKSKIEIISYKYVYTSKYIMWYFLVAFSKPKLAKLGKSVFSPVSAHYKAIKKAAHAF